MNTPDTNASSTRGSRRSERVSCRFVVKLKYPDSVHTAHTVDVSIKGMGLLTKPELPPDPDPQIYCKLANGKIIQMQGEVRFRELIKGDGPPYLRLGVAIANADEAYEKVCMAFIARQKKERQTRRELVHQRVRYKFESELGTGGFASVYKIKDLLLKRSVAMKVLADKYARVPEERASFLREAQIAAQFHHPHIVLVYEVGEVLKDDFHKQLDFPEEILQKTPERLIYFTMQYLEGRTLGQIFKSGKRIKIPDALDILTGVSDALAFAHSKGVVHGDIKPDNIMINRDKQVFVADFGIARLSKDAPQDLDLDTDAHPSLFACTPQYASPEVFKGESSEAPADLYSFGVVAYELLTGVTPFQSKSLKALAKMHLSREPEPISSHRADVPSELEEAIMRCLAKDPAQRYENSGDLLSIFWDIKGSQAGLMRRRSMKDTVDELISKVFIAKGSKESAQLLRDLSAFVHMIRSHEDIDQAAEINAELNDPNFLNVLIEHNLTEDNSGLLLEFFRNLACGSVLFVLFRWFQTVHLAWKKELFAEAIVLSAGDDLVAIPVFGKELPDQDACYLLNAFETLASPPPGELLEMWAQHTGYRTQEALIRQMGNFNATPQMRRNLLQGFAEGRTTVHPRIVDLAKRKLENLG